MYNYAAKYIMNYTLRTLGTLPKNTALYKCHRNSEQFPNFKKFFYKFIIILMIEYLCEQTFFQNEINKPEMQSKFI